MMRTPGIILFLHGFLVFSAGVFAGIPYWQSIIRNKSSETIRSWRVTHTFLTVYGMWIVLVGLLTAHLFLDDVTFLALKWAFALSGYAFAAAFIFGAWKGYRGLTPKPYGLNTLFFLGHFIGICGSIVGMGIILYSIINSFRH